MLGPLALLALAYGRKKSRGKWDMLVILLVLSLGVGLAACGDSDAKVTVTPIPTPDSPKPTLIIKITATPGTSTTLIATPDGSLVDPFEFCNEIVNNAKNIIIFGGSGGDVKVDGPPINSPDGVMIWTTDMHGNDIPDSNWIQYPGWDPEGSPNPISGKARQAVDARAAGNPCDVVIIAYSAGTESALMYARWRLAQGYGVRAVVLLGPTFVSFNETQNPYDWDRANDKTYGKFPYSPLVLKLDSAFKPTMNDGREYYDWSEVMNDILRQNVYILAWDDGGAAAGFTPSSNAIYYERKDKVGKIFHHSSQGTPATNSSLDAKKEVYDWLDEKLKNKP